MKFATTTLTNIANYAPDRRREYTHEPQHNNAKETAPRIHDMNANSPVSTNFAVSPLLGEGRHAEGIVTMALLLFLF